MAMVVFMKDIRDFGQDFFSLGLNLIIFMIIIVIVISIVLVVIVRVVEDWTISVMSLQVNY